MIRPLGLNTIITDVYINAHIYTQPNTTYTFHILKS